MKTAAHVDQKVEILQSRRKEHYESNALLNTSDAIKEEAFVK